MALKKLLKTKAQSVLLVIDQDQLSSKNIPRRKNMNLGSYSYELCNLEVEETTQHLFLNCLFAKIVGRS